jgi:septal ring factor EnvC (AmiA/AmiB activator)
MSRKLFACGLLLVVSFGLSMAGRVSSQDKTPDKDRERVFPLINNPDPAQPLLDQLVQELKNVRAQKVDLDRREQQLMAAIENRINAERQRLEQKVQERRAQLEEIERLIHRDAKGKDTKAVEKGDFKK